MTPPRPNFESDSHKKWQNTEQNRFYLPNEVKLIMKNRKYKWQATKRANCPPKLAALNIAFNLIYVAYKHAERKTGTIK